jgi:PAS domain S-box-containing protein
MEFFFEKIYKFRKKAKISTNDLSKMMGVHRATIWNWENGRKVPSELKVRNLAKILRISVSEISNLEPGIATSGLDLSEILDPWVQFADENSRDLFSKFKEYSFLIQEQYDIFQRGMIVSRALLSAIESILYIKDINNKYVTVNKAFKDNLSLLINYEVVGKNDADLFNEKEAKFNSKQDLEVIRSGRSLKNIEGYIPGSKKKRKGLISKVPIFDSENKIVGVIANFIDITDRIEMSRERRVIEKAINSINDCIWIAKSSGGSINKDNLLFINDAVENLTGSTKENFLKNPDLWEKFVEKKYHKERLKNRFSGKYPTVNEYSAKRVDDSNGEIINIREKIYHDEKDSIFVGIVENITKTKKTEQLRLLLEKVLKESHDIIWIREFPPSNKLLYVSDSVLDIYGYPKELFFEDSDFWYNNCVNIDDKSELLNDRNDMKWPERKTHRAVTSNGDIRWIETSTFQTTFLDNQCVAYIERDITKRIKERENIQNNTKIQIAEILKSKGIDDRIIFEATGLPLESL